MKKIVFHPIKDSSVDESGHKPQTSKTEVSIQVSNMAEPCSVSEMPLQTDARGKENALAVGPYRQRRRPGRQAGGS